MPINKILQSDWCCDYSSSDTSAIRDYHQTLALRLAAPDQHKACIPHSNDSKATTEYKPVYSNVTREHGGH